MKTKKNLTILAIETSCDDTGVAILEISGDKKSPTFKVLSNIVSSQNKVHQKYGGVYPFLAKREHEKNLPIVLKEALKEAKNPKIDLIAITNGPGLEPCLWVGVNFAKNLAQKLNVPLVAVNHIEAHILVNFLENKSIKFPALALIVSGGHTQLILIKKIGKYQILGETRDDAAGECLDKCAKILGLGYPGGPIISKLAEDYTLYPTPYTLKLPRPMIFTKDYDFSFSGLKTAVLYAWKKTPASAKNSSGVARMAAEVQQAVIDVLIKKTLKAAKDYNVKTIILGGGVSANKELRQQFSKKIKKEISNTQFLTPGPELSTDNALMAAITAYFHRNKKIPARQIGGAKDKLEANANLRISR